jgi:hypothetical protein
MSAVLQEPQPVAAPSTSQPTPTPATTGRPPKSASTVWGGDRIALAVWLTGAAIMAFLLLEDLLFALVTR